MKYGKNNTKVMNLGSVLNNKVKLNIISNKAHKIHLVFQTENHWAGLLRLSRQEANLAGSTHKVMFPLIKK
jgi:hypothetical protein